MPVPSQDITRPLNEKLVGQMSVDELQTCMRELLRSELSGPSVRLGWESMRHLGNFPPRLVPTSLSHGGRSLTSLLRTQDEMLYRVAGLQTTPRRASLEQVSPKKLLPESSSTLTCKPEVAERTTLGTEDVVQSPESPAEDDSGKPTNIAQQRSFTSTERAKLKRSGTILDRAIGEDRENLSNNLGREKSESSGSGIPDRWQLCKPSADDTKPLATAKAILRDSRLDLAICVLILSNGLTIGVETEYVLQYRTNTASVWLLLIEIFFCICFSLELYLKVYVFRRHFFRMAGRGWNIFDSFVVTMQVVETFISLVGMNIEFGMVGLVRFLRIVRVARLARTFELISELRMIVFAVLSSFRPLLWTLVLLFLVIYVMAVCVTQAVVTYYLSVDAPDPDVMQFFDSMPRAWLTMFQCVTGGIDWDSSLTPLMRSVSPWMGVAYVFYIGFTVLMLLNVVTGVFVEAVMTRAKVEKEAFALNAVRGIFGEIDMDDDGRISWEELESQMKSQHVVQHLKAIGVDFTDARILFNLLDVNDSGQINAEEFLRGCTRLRGPAKALDFLLLLRETRALMAHQLMLDYDRHSMHSERHGHSMHSERHGDGG